MKLNKTKVRYILRQNCKGVATEEIALDVKVSQRRVPQIFKEYKETGQEPVLGEKVGRPRKPYIEKDAEVIKAAHACYRFGARMLETVIRKQFKIYISHNRIHIARVKHPQTNGTLERFFGEYVKHRSVFHLFDEFISWYNDRPHGRLNFQSLQTPERAFRQKMPLEAYFAIGHRLFEL